MFVWLTADGVLDTKGRRIRKEGDDDILSPESCRRKNRCCREHGELKGTGTVVNGTYSIS